ncbi:cytochrome P450, family 86, subfamily C, polypeptide 1 [Wolffia australiana]
MEWSRGWDVAAALVGLFVFSCIAHRLRDKGPMHWPVLGIIPTFVLNLNRVHDWVTEELASHGGTFNYRGMWLGGAHGVVTSDPTTLEYVLLTRFANFPKGKYYHERFADLLGDGIFNADEGAWRQQRRAAAAEMHSARFADYSAAATASLVHAKLLPAISSIAAKTQRVDIQELLLNFTFDSICVTALGVDSPEMGFAKAFERATELTMLRFIVPPFVWKILKKTRIGFERELEDAILVVHGFVERVIADRRIVMPLNTRSDLLSRLIENQFSDKFIKDFCVSFLLAGRDTSSVALVWFFWLLHSRPEVEDRILDEIYSVLRQSEKKGKDGFGEVVFEAEELEKMDYLQAAISEALRLYPPVPFDWKEAKEDDVFPGGTLIRKGGRVVYSIYSMGRAEALWGKDCKEYRPERWLEEEDGRFRRENQFKYLVFNGGPRLCLGKKFAYLQMKMVAAAVLFKYKVRVGEGQVVEPKLTTTLFMRNGLLVTFEEREKHSSTGL